MAILDAQNQFSDSQALTATAVSTNIIDLSEDRNIGVGEPMAVLINVEVAADIADGDETYQFDLQTDDNSGFSSAVVLHSRTVARATLVAGFSVVLHVPKDDISERFLRLNYTLGGTTPSITISAHLVPLSFIEARHDYPSGFSILQG